MSRRLSRGEWREMRSQIRHSWDRLTDDDLETVTEQSSKSNDQRQKHDYAREEAEEKLYRPSYKAKGKRQGHRERF